MTVTLTKLEPRLQTLPVHAGTALWVMTATASVTDTLGADSNIFVYRAGAAGTQGDQFAGVCSASQMRDLPFLRADMQGSYYRSNIAVFLCRSAAEMDAVWQKLQSDVVLLTRDWVKLAGATPSSVVTITPSSIATEDPIPQPDLASAAVRFNVDGSRVLFYNAAGDLIGEVALALPS